ncbi:putative NADP(+)-dependent dehydrogenase [Xylariaceae sp. FL0804]|nr:putative NADP(+)-dependent dehydrogenase [Xylariaceae sp. FL0804]
MQPPLPSATATWHNDTYEAISPRRPELSAAGKTVIITGAGRGIGREIAVTFAAAGASRLILLGRDATSLEETASLLPGGATASTHAVDVADGEALQSVASSIPRWDVMVLAAGYLSGPGTMVESDADDWWKSFETNAKGTYLCIKSFAPTADPSHATVLALTSGMTAPPAKTLPGLSAYLASKLAVMKMIEYLPAEQPNIFAATVHPGLVESDMFYKAGGDPTKLPVDKVQLPAHFLLWMSSPEAAFLNGRSVWANWDVDELKEQAEAIESGSLMTSGTYGWPYTSPQ